MTQIPADRDAAGDELVDLAQQAFRMEDDAAGDDAEDAGRKNAAGDERKFIGFSPRHDGMAGVRAPLITDDEVVLLGEQIDELPLGLISPLQSDDARSRQCDTSLRSAR